jgi:hypothetical protein
LGIELKEEIQKIMVSKNTSQLVLKLKKFELHAASGSKFLLMIIPKNAVASLPSPLTKKIASSMRS